MTQSSEIRRLWPDPQPDAAPLDQAALAAAYAPPPPPATRASLRINFVSSADGAVTVSGRSGGLSSPSDKRVFNILRVHCDALVVGAGTLRVEGYGPLRLRDAHRATRVSLGHPEHPTLVIVSARLDLDPSHPMLTDAPVRPVVLTHDASPADRRDALAKVADVLVFGEIELDLPAALTELRGRGFATLLSEGGPHLLGALTAADLVDELCLTVAPLLAGPGAGRITAGVPVEAPRELNLVHVLGAGDELLLRYARAHPAATQ